MKLSQAIKAGVQEVVDTIGQRESLDHYKPNDRALFGKTILAKMERYDALRIFADAAEGLCKSVDGDDVLTGYKEGGKSFFAGMNTEIAYVLEGEINEHLFEYEQPEPQAPSAVSTHYNLMGEYAPQLYTHPGSILEPFVAAMRKETAA